MTVTLYKSTDASAPTLSGTAGDLTNLLDKILVDGYGSKTAAGWAVEFTGTNKRVYRAPASPANNRFRVRVDDVGTISDAKVGYVRGYESMTDIDTGTLPFPTVAQLTDGVVIRKSATADATTRSWIAIADGQTFYLFIASSTFGASEPIQTLAFGSFASFVTGDNFRTFLVGAVTNTATSTLFDNFIASPGVQSAHYLSRGYSGTGGPIQFGKVGNSTLFAGSSTSGSGSIPYPNPADGGLYLQPIPILDNTTSPTGHLRGRFRGVYFIAHPPGSFVNGDTFSGATGSVYDGKTFEVIKGFYNSGAFNGVMAIETSDTWETTT